MIYFRDGKIFIKVGSIMERILNFVFSSYYKFIALTPWRQATVLLAFKNYLEGGWFRERSMVLGVDEAINQFYMYDYKFLISEAKKKNKWKIIFRPYTCIEEAKKTMRTINAMGMDLEGALERNNIK